MSVIPPRPANISSPKNRSIVDALDISADMLLCDVIRNGYKIKTSILTEKLEKLSPSDREKILQMIDIMTDGN